MSVEDALASFERLKKRLSSKKSATVGAQEDLNLVRATAEAWFRTFRPRIVELMGSVSLEAVDASVQGMLRLTLNQNTRRSYLDELRTVIRILKQDLLVESKVAEWSREKSSDGSLGDRAVAARLEGLEPALADAYRQVLMDLQDDQRLSYRGPGNELRELLREVLDLLAPGAKVKSEQWFRDSRASGPKDKRDRPPTQAEKARYIARSRGLGDTAADTVQEAATTIEERVGAVVRSLYKRTNSAAHVQRERSEIAQLIRYLDALLLELLPD